MSQSRRHQTPFGQFLCPCCQEWKYKHEFYNNKRTLDNVSTYCKECQKMKQKYYSPAAKEARRVERENQAVEDLALQMINLQNQPPTGPPTD